MKIEWKGGTIPVLGKTRVRYWMRFESRPCSATRADMLRWSDTGRASDIVAYEVGEPAVKPFFEGTHEMETFGPLIEQAECRELPELPQYQYLPTGPTPGLDFPNRRVVPRGDAIFDRHSDVERGRRTPIPADAKARKALPLFSGFVKYFPDAMVAVAEVSRLGNDQHNPGKALFWDRSKSGDELDALARHLIEAGTLDTDGVRHSAKVAWRAMANLQKEIEGERE